MPTLGLDTTRLSAWLVVTAAIALYALLFRGFLGSVDDARRRISEDPGSGTATVRAFVRRWSIPSAVMGAPIVVAVALFVGVSSIAQLALAAALGAVLGVLDFALRARVFWLTAGSVARWERRQLL
jgi:hypothetical protein